MGGRIQLVILKDLRNDCLEFCLIAIPQFFYANILDFAQDYFLHKKAFIDKEITLCLVLLFTEVSDILIDSSVIGICFRLFNFLGKRSLYN